MDNLPTTNDFMTSSRRAFDSAYRTYRQWRSLIGTGEDLDGARRTLTAVDGAIVALTGCRQALAYYIEEHQ